MFRNENYNITYIRLYVLFGRISLPYSIYFYNDVNICLLLWSLYKFTCNSFCEPRIFRFSKLKHNSAYTQGWISNIVSDVRGKHEKEIPTLTVFFASEWVLFIQYKGALDVQYETEKDSLQMTSFR